MKKNTWILDSVGKVLFFIVLYVQYIVWYMMIIIITKKKIMDLFFVALKQKKNRVQHWIFKNHAIFI